MPRKPVTTQGGGTVELVLDTCLRELAEAQKTQPPEERRYVPTEAEIADAIGMTHPAFSRMTNNKTYYWDRRKLAGIIDFLRRFGHEVDETDILTYVPASNNGHAGAG